jgi:hypothetical protein
MDILAKIRIDIYKNIPIILDQFLLFITGVVLIIKSHWDSISSWIGVVIIIVSVIQVIRRVKQFVLFTDKLIITRPLFPFHLADINYKLNEIKEVKFHKIKGRFGGSFVTIRSVTLDGSYLIASDKESIDYFEMQLQKLGIKTIRDGL